MGDKRVGIVIYGKCKQFEDFWKKWLDESKDVIKEIGYVPTHLDIMSDLSDERILNMLRGFIDLKKGEVYAMNKEKVPLNYVMNKRQYATLEILKVI